MRFLSQNALNLGVFNASKQSSNKNDNRISCKEVLEYVDKNYFFPRILKVESSLKKCEDLGIASDHILAMNGVSSKEDNIFLIQKYDAAVIITKESGETGGLFEKISAANEIGINIVLVDRPEVPNLNESNVVDNFNELLIRLNS